MCLFQYFNTIDAAYNYAEGEIDNPLILIHSGVYQGEVLVIDSNVTMLGAGTFFCLVMMAAYLFKLKGGTSSRRNISWIINSLSSYLSLHDDSQA